VAFEDGYFVFFNTSCKRRFLLFPPLFIEQTITFNFVFMELYIQDVKVLVYKPSNGTELQYATFITKDYVQAALKLLEDKSEEAVQSYFVGWRNALSLSHCTATSFFGSTVNY